MQASLIKELEDQESQIEKEMEVKKAMQAVKTKQVQGALEKVQDALEKKE